MPQLAIKELMDRRIFKYGVKVEMPFLPEFQSPLLSGKKTLTSRTKWHGTVGDHFEAFGRIFVLTREFTAALETVATYYFAQEGVASPEEFKEVWCRLHPRARWRPAQRVRCHEFQSQVDLAVFHVHEMYMGQCQICGFVPQGDLEDKEV